MRFLVCIIFSIFVLGCQQKEITEQSPSVDEITVWVEPLDAQTWSVEIATPRPVEALAFLRNTGNHRLESWSFEDSDIELKRINNRDVITAKSGEPIQFIRAKLTPYRNSIAKEYLLFGEFSNGAQRVFAGQFRLHYADADGNYEPVERRSQIQFLPGVYGKFFADGSWRGAPFTVDGTTDENDRYVVYGAVPLTEFSGGSLMVDPGLPLKIQDQITNVMMKSATYFASKLGPSDGRDRLTLISFVPDETMNGTSIEGGVLADQIHFHLTGSGWDEVSEDTGLELGWVSAHEVAHVWNSFGNSKPDYFNIEPGDTESDIPDAQWMHEGGADILTYKAVIANDLATPEYLKQKISGYYQNCQQALGRGALNNAAREGRFRDYYDCGFVIGLVTDLACQKDGRNYIDVWNRMIELSPNGKYGQQLYLVALSECTGSDNAVQAIKTMAISGVDAPDEFLRQMFLNYGVDVKSSGGSVTFTPPL